MRDVELGCRVRRRRRVSPTTACKWWRRWSEATLELRIEVAFADDQSAAAAAA
jgi:hypothetical protein